MTDAALSFLMGMGAGAAVLAIALILIGGALLRAASAEIDRTIFPNKPKPRSDEETARAIVLGKCGPPGGGSCKPGELGKVLGNSQRLMTLEDLAALEEAARRAQR